VEEVLLVRYGELALKSPPVRAQFERQLKNNLLDAFLQAGLDCALSSDRGHLYVSTSRPEEGVKVIRRTFGVVSVSRACVLKTSLDGILRAVVETFQEPLAHPHRFAVRSRRTGSHAFTSQELAARVGEEILRAFPHSGLVVDLEEPDLEIFVEVRGPTTYLYMSRMPGPGGLPLGVAGNVGAVVDGLRGALGAFLLMKRGCRAHVAAVGEGWDLSREVLSRFDPHLVVQSAPDAPGAWDLVRSWAESKPLEGVSLPLDVDDYGPARDFWGETVVFSPTVGLSEQEVHEQWLAVVELTR
jgi:thiamine biosynthesis protein ThiI